VFACSSSSSSWYRRRPRGPIHRAAAQPSAPVTWFDHCALSSECRVARVHAVVVTGRLHHDVVLVLTSAAAAVTRFDLRGHRPVRRLTKRRIERRCCRHPTRLDSLHSPQRHSQFVSPSVNRTHTRAHLSFEYTRSVSTVLLSVSVVIVAVILLFIELKGLRWYCQRGE